MTGIYQLFEVHYKKKGKADKRYVLAENVEQAEEIVQNYHGDVVFEDIDHILFLSPWGDYDLDLERVIKGQIVNLSRKRPEKMRIEITDAKCENCGKKVIAEANLASVFEIKKGKTKNFLINRIYTYWSCPRCGCVWAKIKGNSYATPSELFKEIEFSDWKTMIRRNLIESERE